MATRLSLLWLLILLAYVERNQVKSQSPSGFYLITAYNYIRPSTNYRVAVSWTGVDKNTKPLVVSVSLTSASGRYKSNGVKTVYPGETSYITIMIGKWANEDYTLRIEGKNGTEFSEIRRINFLNIQSSSTFIQMDKSLYKANQIVFFRVISIDAELKPSPFSNVTVKIKDAERNLVKLDKGIELSKGVYSSSLQLSDRPILGDWTIEAYVQGETHERIFTVDEYVLPIFDIAITPPTSASPADEKFIVIAQANYAYLKPVSGRVSYRAKIKNCFTSGCETPVKISNLDKNGKLTLNIPSSELSRITSFTEAEVIVDVTVEEDKTGRDQRKSVTFPVRQKQISLSITTSPAKYKPGLQLLVTVQLIDQNGNPVLNPSPDSTIVTLGSQQSSISLSETGFGQILYTVPDTTNGNLTIQASYRIVNSRISVEKAESQRQNYISLNTIGAPAYVSGVQQFEIVSTFDMSEIYYEVMGRGEILLTKKVSATTNSPRRQVISVQITTRMTPSAYILAYIITKGGEIIADLLEFSVNGFLPTPVILECAPDDVKPHTDVSISVQTNPNAFVGLCAIDQNVLTLKSNNDITELQIKEQYKKYLKASSNSSNGNGRLDQVFKLANLWYFTNSPFEYPETSRVVAARLAAPPLPLFALNELMSNVGGDLFAGVMTTGPSGSFLSAVEPFLNSLSLLPMVSNDLYVRENFPETWIWRDLTAGNNGVARIVEQVPDSITSWVVSAFAMDDVTGLGVSKEISKVRVFRDFFVVLNLPYSIVKGEKLSLQAIVFNYLDTDITANVTLSDINKDFYLLDDESKGKDYSTKFVKIKAGQTEILNFWVSARKVGTGILQVSAISTSGNVGDIVRNQLLVKAPGTTFYFNKPIFIDLRTERNFQNISIFLDIPIPGNAYKGSERIEVSAIGDILGPALQNLGDLLRMPYGCGEQNMVRFVPDVLVLTYLKSVNKLTPEINQTALSYIQEGYAIQLNNKRPDNSFSLWGDGFIGSTWLTALTVKSFSMAKPFIQISDEVINNALTFLKSKQNDTDGSFIEQGSLHNKDIGLKGGVSIGVPLTAYVLIAFIEAKNPNFGTTVAAAVTYLENNLAATTDKYSIAIMAYALQSAGSRRAEEAFRKLKSILTYKDNEIFVTITQLRGISVYSSYGTPSLNVEATSYALLTFLQRNDVIGGIPLMRWLIQQRNKFGGFTSTQDTVIGLEALAKIAAKLSSGGNNPTNIFGPKSVQIDFVYSQAKPPVTMLVMERNEMVLQSQVLPSDVRNITTYASGTGFALAQISWSYNVFESVSSDGFSLTVSNNKDGETYNIFICASYQSLIGIPSNMAIVKIELPSGYIVDTQSLPSKAQNEHIDNVEMRQDNVMIVYFDYFDNEDSCFSAVAVQQVVVSDLQPGTVTVQDYYNPDKFTMENIPL